MSRHGHLLLLPPTTHHATTSPILWQSASATFRCITHKVSGFIMPLLPSLIQHMHSFSCQLAPTCSPPNGNSTSFPPFALSSSAPSILHYKSTAGAIFRLRVTQKTPPSILAQEKREKKGGKNSRDGGMLSVDVIGRVVMGLEKEGAAV